MEGANTRGDALAEASFNHAIKSESELALIQPAARVSLNSYLSARFALRPGPISILPLKPRSHRDRSIHLFDANPVSSCSLTGVHTGVATSHQAI